MKLFISILSIPFRGLLKSNNFYRLASQRFPKTTDVVVEAFGLNWVRYLRHEKLGMFLSARVLQNK